jgi:hypothetical protein
MSMTMEHRQIPEADHVARARSLLAAAGEGVNQLKSACNEALHRYFTLTGMLVRLKQLTASPEPEAAGEAAIYAAALCREALALLRDLHSRGRRRADVRLVPRERKKPSASAKAGSATAEPATGVR